MRKTRSLTKNPTLLAAVLSLAAVAGYVGYRLTLGAGQQDMPASSGAADRGDLDQTPEQRDLAAQPKPLLDELPEIVLDNLEGNPTALSDFAGKRLVINYWATWCAPCLREIPMLKAFHEAHAGIEVIGIAADYVDDVVEFSTEMDFNYPVLVGQNDAMNAAAALGVEVLALPFTVFTAADGAILGIHTGEIHPEHLERLVETLAALDSGEIDRETARTRLGQAL